MIDASYGQLVRASRKRQRLSLRQLAAHPSVYGDHTRISKIENGVEIGSERLARELDAALAAGGALVAAWRQAHLQRREAGDPMRRRTMLQALTALSIGAGTSPHSREALRHGLGLALGHDCSVEDWAEIALDYARDFFTTAPVQIVDEVAADLVVLEQMLDAETSPAVKRDLSTAGAQLSVVMAMGLASLGQHRHARRWWSTAKTTADYAGEASTRMWVRDWEAVNGLYERRPLGKVISLAEEGLAVSDTVCTGRAGLLSGVAQAKSVQGDAEGALAALAELETVTADMPGAVRGDVDSMHGWPDFRLHHTASYVHTHLGDTRAAYTAQDAAFAIYPADLARERTQMQMHRAACIIIDGDIPGGLDYAHGALDDLPAELHNALLFQIGRKVIDVVPAAERSRPDAVELDRRMGTSALPALES